MSQSVVTILTCILCLCLHLCLCVVVPANPLVLQNSNHREPTAGPLKPQFDVVIVGGGPAGLSALCSLARVRHEVLLIDSGEYRNSPSRRVRDTIGSDDIPPALFRYRARQKAAQFTSATLQNGTVESIVRGRDNSTFTTTLSNGQSYTSRKIILATGLRDVLPNVPGIEDAWGRGMYWCAWCDGWEHRDQSLGIITTLPKLVQSVIHVSTLNKDIIAFVNGTDTPANRQLLAASAPGWEKYLKQAGVKIENRKISGFERLQDGSIFRNETSSQDYDRFRVYLEDGIQILRSAFLASFPKVQRSYAGAKIGVQLVDEKIYVESADMKAAPGVWAVGDANSDNSTNVPHALYSGKKAAVSAHFELGSEGLSEPLIAITKRSESDLLRDMENGLEEIWDSIK